jgi:hypothetical protein
VANWQHERKRERGKHRLLEMGYVPMTTSSDVHPVTNWKRQTSLHSQLGFGLADG